MDCCDVFAWTTACPVCDSSIVRLSISCPAFVHAEQACRQIECTSRNCVWQNIVNQEDVAYLYANDALCD